ncbi:DUF4175 domain-containing protein [Candidatus Woesearchaeota archaeon]|nr:DUF4175 domain-containing protein [Candidatus Woesearchaeota archaeon]
MKKLLVLLLAVMLLVPCAYAKEITFSVGQKEYYFLTGEEAIINLKTENTYKKGIEGILSYKITQNINQGGFQYSSSNSQSSAFSVSEGENEVPIGLGTSDSPAELTLDLTFSYAEKDDMEVILEGIKVYFVQDQQQKSSQKDEQKSSSQKKDSGNGNEPSSSRTEQMQQMMEKMFGNGQQQSPDTQQKLQNSQMPQDSSALKQQMQKQVEEQQRLKEEFQKELADNGDFQKEHQDLLDKGYKVEKGELNPSSKDTGSFDLQYKDDKGEQASLKGNMQDGEIKDMQKDTPEQRKEMLDKLNNDERFMEMQQKLQSQGLNAKEPEFSIGQNKSTIRIGYEGEGNKTAEISAEFINGSIEKVELKKDSDAKRKSYLWIFLLAAALAAAGILYAYRHKKSKRKEAETEDDEAEEPFDYIAESRAMLEKAKELFRKKEYKESYGKAGQALRLYLSYKNKLKKELTNDDMISHLKKNKKPYKEVKGCFDLCSLVEFAKYKANKEDFGRIMEYAEKVIK